MSFVKEKVPLHRRIVSSTTSFVFDGNAFVHWICNSTSFPTPWSCPLLDVDYITLHEKTIAIIEKVRRSGASILFIFDSIVTIEKITTKFGRIKEQNYQLVT